jgi:hypothetical protein
MGHLRSLSGELLELFAVNRSWNPAWQPAFLMFTLSCHAIRTER